MSLSKAKNKDMEIAENTIPEKNARQLRDVKDYTTTVTILESITDAIFILNAEGTIEYANRSAQEYLQIPMEQILGMGLDSFISSDGGEIRELLDHGIRQERGNIENYDELFSSSEAELIGAKEPVPVLINYSVVPDPSSQLKYLIVTAKGIAYRKSLEKELKNHQALSTSFDRLKALGEMSVGLVHTLGQPVSAMELRLDHLRKMNDLGAIQSHVTELQKDIKRISGIVEKVRSYAQVMADRHNRPVDIHKIIGSILQILEYDLRVARVNVDLKLSHEMPEIEANEPELEQVFINLLTNAIHAYESNGIYSQREMLITTTAVENKWIKVKIKDNAGGISPTIMPKIFDPFFSTWDRNQHAGTGLSVSRSILSSLGGDLKAECLEGGTEFSLRIPIVQQEERTQLVNMIELLNS